MRQNKPLPKHLSRKITGIWIVIMFVFIAELLIYTWCRVQNTQQGYDITGLQAESRQLMLVQKSLKIELARLKSPDRIARIARDTLGLVTPKTQQLVDME
ncbi:MAG: septum formation initiator family protein [Pseudomonadota bacterium]